MLEFFQALGQAFESVLAFIFNIIEGLIFLITMIPSALDTLQVSLGYMPSILAGFALVGILICIVFQLIGR